MTDIRTQVAVGETEGDQQAKARRTIKRHAVDPKDFQMLVDMLGLPEEIA